MYLDYKKQKNVFLIDIECDSLTPTRIWCMVVKELHSGKIWKFADEHNDPAKINHELKKFFEEVTNEGVLVAHNGISFDFPVLVRLCGAKIPRSRCVDTLVLSYLYNPQLVGGHSLEAYGERLKISKVGHEDWSQFSPAMMQRCTTDVEILEGVYCGLTTRMSNIGFSEFSCYIEHETRYLIDQQQTHGFYFKRSEAEQLLTKLRSEEASLTVPIQKLFPPRLVEFGTYKRRYKQNGEPTASFYKHLESYPKITDGPEEGSYTVWGWEEFNIASPSQRVSRLEEYGYDPVDRTPSGAPKVDEQNLLKFVETSGLKEAGLIADWLVVNGRANMIQTWLDNCHPDSRIHGKVMTCAASTRRMTHSSPNTANIPHPAKAKYGHECRSLWSVEPLKGLSLVGADAAALETVGLCHYLNNPKATHILTQEKPNDVHSNNARTLTDRLGRPIIREDAKTAFYAWLYGAYAPKLGQIVKGPKTDGELVIDSFFRNVPGLQGLIDTVHSEYHGNQGLLRTIDGGFVRCPSLNAALNYKIQSMGAIVMKLAAINLRTEAFSRGIEYQTVGTIHDEWQIESASTDAEEIGKLAVQSITSGAEHLRFSVPLGGDYKVGQTWAETH